MAQSAVQLRGMVDAANQEMEEARQYLRMAKDKVQQAVTEYRRISDQLSNAVGMAYQTERAADEAMVQAANTIDLANAYSATL